MYVLAVKYGWQTLGDSFVMSVTAEGQRNKAVPIEYQMRSLQYEVSKLGSRSERCTVETPCDPADQAFGKTGGIS